MIVTSASLDTWLLCWQEELCSPAWIKSNVKCQWESTVLTNKANEPDTVETKKYIPHTQLPMPYLVTLHEHVCCASNQFTKARLILRLLVSFFTPFTDNSTRWSLHGRLRSISAILPQLQEPSRTKNIAPNTHVPQRYVVIQISLLIWVEAALFFIEFV